MHSLDRSNRRAASAFIFMLCGLLGACGDDGGTPAAESGGATGTASDGADGSSTAGAGFDEAEVIEAASQYATAMVQINDTSFGSQHGLAASVNVFVDTATADLYRTLDPAAPAELAFPEGALIVKEHLDADGGVLGFNLMYRAAEGYNPEGSDWYWARVDASGVAAESGTIGYCIACHAAAPSHIFGVATDNRR